MERPLVMGIINVTPDSFYAGSRMQEMAATLTRADQMIRDGAALLDIGGQSTRPGARPVDAREERDRVLPVIEAIKQKHPDIYISIDTFNAEVAAHAIKAGADIVNDISAGTMDPGMLATVGAAKVPYIAMHMKGTPQTMQSAPRYDDVALELMDYFTQKVAECRHHGIGDIILDPGFGFAKNLAHNYELMRRLETMQVHGLPLLVGISRKSMIYVPLEIGPEEALAGTSALHMIALQKGARILRAHDVKEAAQIIKLYNLYQTL